MQLHSYCKKITFLKSLFLFAHKSQNIQVTVSQVQQMNAPIRRSGSLWSPSAQLVRHLVLVPLSLLPSPLRAHSGLWCRGLRPCVPQSAASCHSAGPDGARSGHWPGPQSSWQPARWPCHFHFTGEKAEAETDEGLAWAFC